MLKIDKYQNEIKQFREWLHNSGGNRLSKWETLFLKNNQESALCEAMTYNLLVENGCSVEPFEDLSNGGVDFKCSHGNKRFYVEVTCISCERVTNKSGLSDITEETEFYDSLTQSFRDILSGKVSQCSDLDAPCLVAIGTFHYKGSILCFNDMKAEELLTGERCIAMKIDPEIEHLVGQPFQKTKLDFAAFLRPDKSQKGKIEYVKNPISGVLLCAFGAFPYSTVGIIHPNPNKSFETELLPKIKFGKLKDGYEKSNNLEVEWLQTKEAKK